MRPLRIFYAAEPSPHRELQSNVWRNNLLLPLRELGHDVVEFEYDLQLVIANQNSKERDQAAYIASNRPKVTRALLQQLEQAHHQRPLDVFFSYFTDACITTEAIDYIRSLGICCINWYCNGSNHLDLVQDISPRYDYCLVPEKFRLEDYRQMGANPIYCQEAANPAIYKPVATDQIYDVTFVGQKYGSRPHYLRSLVAAGVDVRAWGVGWQATQNTSSQLRKIAGRIKRKVLGQADTDLPAAHCSPPLSDEEFIAMYSRSRISLGFTQVNGVPHDKLDQPMKQVRLRDFEATLSGAFYLVEYCEELTDFFEPDREIVCFADETELVEKAKYYLANPQQRERIRAAGLQRARNEHTWQHRFAAVFEQIGLTTKVTETTRLRNSA